MGERRGGDERRIGDHGISTTREARGFVDGDGIRLAWGMWPGIGAPVVGLHGVTASLMNFVGIADQLAARRPILAFDLRGRGDSDKPEGPYGMRQHARDVAAAMRAFGLGPSVIVGHSMGAFVTAALAVEHPELVAGTVLVDGGLPLEPPPGIEPADLLDVVLAPQMARLRATYGSEHEYFDFWRALPTFDGGRWNRYVEEYLRYDLGADGRPKASEAAVRADFQDTLDGNALAERVATMTAPCRLLLAEEGFLPGSPPLLPDELVARYNPGPATRVPDTTHYTIALGADGAAVVADAIVKMAEATGR